MWLYITYDVLFIPTSNLLSQKKGIRRIFEQQKNLFLKKIRSKEKVTHFLALSNYNKLYITCKKI